MSQKPTFEEYPEWLHKGHGVVVDDRLRNRYATVAAAIHRDFLNSPFWYSCTSKLSEFDAEYQVMHGYRLLDPTDAPDLLVKEFPSFLLKTYRKNVSDNPAWPDPPPQSPGWFLPVDCLERVHDVVRTCFVLKYLDGVEFLVERFRTLAAEHAVGFRVDFEAKEEGYYAAHAYISRTFEVPAEKWDTQQISASVELQVTTQVQELIRRLLHRYYEERRSLNLTAEIGKWQWDYRSDEFATNYLGHILHYVEGMIMDIRDRQSDRSAP